MKIDIKDIRQRLSENTAIDAKEIQSLCDEVKKNQWIEVKTSNIYKELDRFQQEEILYNGKRISFVSMDNINAIFEEIGYKKEPEF